MRLTRTYETFLQNNLDSIKILRELGLVINLQKSILNPTQTIVFLGFIISSKA